MAEHRAQSRNMVAITGLVLLAALMLVGTSINLTGGFRHTADANDVIAVTINQSNSLAPNVRLALFAKLRDQQEALLVQNPYEPYAWLRLSYLRHVTLGNRASAFEAVRFADKVARPDKVGGLERILIWHDYADVHTDADKAHERQMWRTAYSQKWPYLGETANKRGLYNVLIDAIKEDPELYDLWQMRHKK